MDCKLEQNYEIKNSKVLGKGGFGQVIQVYKKGTKIKRAVKIIPKKRVKNPKLFQTEIDIMKNLDHPNIIKLYEIYEDQRNLYLVMELCTGGELFDKITQVKKFNENQARDIFKQIVHAVVFCHRNGICHRDLKPENFLLYDQSDDFNLKVIDFGLSCIYHDVASDQTYKMSGKAGSSYYMSPEVIKGGYNELTDVWSLGVILYILLSGFPPFYGNNDDEIMERILSSNYSFKKFRQFDSVSQEAKDLISKCLVPQKDRITAAQLLEEDWMKMTDSQTRQLQINFKDLESFSHGQKLKKIALTYLATQLSTEEIQELGRLFKQIDKNNDGLLSFEEIQESLSNGQGSEINDNFLSIIQSIDTDKSGKIDYNEFIAASIEQSVYMSQDNLFMIFQMIDEDGSGTISVDELRKALGSQAKSDEYYQQIIQECDKNGDGEIDYNEFVEMMAKI